MEDNNDVDLYKQLEDALNASENKVEDTKTDESTEGASAQDDSNKGEEQKVIEPSARENERVRKLAEENKHLKGDDLPYNSIDDFLGAIEDEPSRNLLTTFAKIQKREFEQRIDPLFQERRGNEFDKEFNAVVEKMPQLEAYRNDMRKTYTRNPSSKVKDLIGGVVVDRLLNAKPSVEASKVRVTTSGATNLDDMSLENLYATLDSLKK